MQLREVAASQGIEGLEPLQREVTLRFLEGGADWREEIIRISEDITELAGRIAALSDMIALHTEKETK